MSTEVTCGKDELRAAPKHLPIAASRRAYAIRFVPLAVGLCALPFFTSGYALTLAVEVMIAGVFASGINLLTGYTGLVSLGQAMFLGLGGYGIAIGTALLGWPLWVSAPVTLVAVATRRRVFADYPGVFANVLWCCDQAALDQRLRRHDRHPASGSVAAWRERG
jgi:branched-chain amino acid transport system permease protein